MTRERFAPSPTGFLHLGHAYSALLGYEAAQEAGGEWLLRIEDIDFTRSRLEYVQGIFEDLQWLGISWKSPVLFQSERAHAYDEALEKLRQLGVIYGCKCTRKELALSAPHGEQSFYPKICHGLELDGDDLNWRLDAEKAMALVGPIEYREIGQGRDHWVSADKIDDVVLARKDIGTSYHLAVVVDDAYQGITHVTRGEDLESQTPIHVLLQKLLDLPTPIYRHHLLIGDENKKRLAKRNDSRAIKIFRELEFSPDEVKKILETSKIQIKLVI